MTQRSVYDFPIRMNRFIGLCIVSYFPKQVAPIIYSTQPGCNPGGIDVGANQPLFPIIRYTFVENFFSFSKYGEHESLSNTWGAFQGAQTESRSTSISSKATRGSNHENAMNVSMQTICLSNSVRKHVRQAVRWYHRIMDPLSNNEVSHKVRHVDTVSHRVWSRTAAEKALITGSMMQIRNYRHVFKYKIILEHRVSNLRPAVLIVYTLCSMHTARPQPGLSVTRRNVYTF